LNNKKKPESGRKFWKEFPNSVSGVEMELFWSQIIIAHFGA
jgi:hypothetical protein